MELLKQLVDLFAATDQEANGQFVIGPSILDLLDFIRIFPTQT